MNGLPARATEQPAFWLVASVLLAVGVQAYAALDLRGIYADGAYFAVRIATEQGYYLHPARRLSQILTQSPVLAAMWLGVTTPHGIALAFSLATNLIPGAIILLCWPALAADQRRYFVLPAFAYFAGILGAQFASVTEGLAATACFWLQLCLVTFSRMTPVRTVLVLALAAGSIDMHEEMAFLGPVLSLACFLRGAREPAPALAGLLLAAAMLDLAGSGVAVWLIVHPVDAAERDWFFGTLLAGEWLYSRRAGWNTPWILAIGAAAAIGMSLVLPRWRHAAAWLFGGTALLIAAASFVASDLVAPETQFAARHNGGFISLPLGLAMLALRARPPIRAEGSAGAIVALLGLSVSLWHVAATLQWSAFLSRYGQMLQSTTGVIPYAWIANRQGSPAQRLAARMIWNWTNPDMSLVVVPRRCITSVVGNPVPVRWQPYDAFHVETMPRLAGITYAYHLPPGQHAAICAASPGQ